VVSEVFEREAHIDHKSDPHILPICQLRSHRVNVGGQIALWIVVLPDRELWRVLWHAGHFTVFLPRSKNWGSGKMCLIKRDALPHSRGTHRKSLDEHWGDLVVARTRIDMLGVSRVVDWQKEYPAPHQPKRVRGMTASLLLNASQAVASP
jgi:hypothetical protein